MKHSESLTKLAPALAKAQAQVRPAFKTGFNPHFKSRFADFSSVLDACEDALEENGLAVLQAPINDENGIGVETMILHSSGEWISERFTLPMAKKDPQGGGSCITYARRFALEGIMRIRREDDDGNGASEQENAQKSGSVLRDEALTIMREAAKKGTVAFDRACNTLSDDMKRAVGKAAYDEVKALAARSDPKDSRKPEKASVA